MIYLCVVANYGLSATNKYHEKPTTKMTWTTGTYNKPCATLEVSHCRYELASKNASQSLHIPL